MSEILKLPTRETASDELGEPWAYKSREVADHLGISLDSLYRIPPEALTFRKTRGGERRYRASDVRAYEEETTQ